METKYFSVVIPTYNSSKYLRELLQSLKNLKFLNDVVITDDCSHSEEYKNLIEIIKEVEFKDLNISLSRNEYNIGGFKNKYKGIELAKNKIFSIILYFLNKLIFDGKNRSPLFIKFRLY